MVVAPQSKNSKSLQRKTLKPDVPLIIYDGDCPFCCAYVRLHRFREDIGPVELLSARDADDRIAHYQQL
jgi:predicted DCC family thiol-disulfide oxidoreductase YuxK